MNKNWYNIIAKTAEKTATEILLYGEIGESFWSESVSAKEFLDKVKAIEGDILLRIHSPGGSVFDAVAIYNYMKQRGGFSVIVDGLAASAASVIALGGSTLPKMGVGTALMIHNPWTWAQGDSEELEKQAKTLEKITDDMVKIYSSVTKIEEKEIRKLMDAETWIMAEEAVEKGWASEVISGEQTKAQASFQHPIFKSISKMPQGVKALLGVVENNVPAGGGNNNKQNKEDKTVKKNIQLLLAAAGMNIADGMSDEQISAATTEAVATIGKLKNELTEQKQITAKAAISAAIAAGKVKPEAEADWTSDYVADAKKTQARIDSIPTPKATGTDPIPKAGGTEDDGEHKGPNPFAKATLNATEQAKIFKKNPELAKKLQAKAAAENPLGAGK